jgi:hypothetical protein
MRRRRLIADVVTIGYVLLCVVALRIVVATLSGR